MIKVIICDIGGVLVHLNKNNGCKKLGKYSPSSVEEIYKKAYSSDPFYMYERGEITSREFYNIIKEDIKLSLDYNGFKEVFSDIFSVNKNMIELIKKLKSKYSLIILSNTNEISYNFLKKKYPVIFELFNDSVLSYEVKCDKPNKKIYEIALDTAKCSSKECLFIDDVKVNVDSAKELGINAIQYETFEQTKQEMKNFGVII